MRIISGTARGRQLASFSGSTIRPTSDRVREALFSVLTSRFGSFNNLKVLELFCGSGAQSLEAISRGAAYAWMIDNSTDGIKTSQQNIRLCHFEEKTKLIRQDVYNALPLMQQYAPFDLILLDPPYNLGHLSKSLKMLESLQLLADNGLICAESARNEDPGEYAELSLINERTYGSTHIYLFANTRDLT